MGAVDTVSRPGVHLADPLPRCSAPWFSPGKWAGTRARLQDTSRQRRVLIARARRHCLQETKRPRALRVSDVAPRPQIPAARAPTGAELVPAPPLPVPSSGRRAPGPAAARDAGRAAPAATAGGRKRRRRRRPASGRHGGGGDSGGARGARAHAELRAASAAQLGQRAGGGAGLRGLRLGAGAPRPGRARAPGAARAAAAGARRARLDGAALRGHQAPLSGQCRRGPGSGVAGWGAGLLCGAWDADSGPLRTPFCLSRRGHWNAGGLGLELSG